MLDSECRRPWRIAINTMGANSSVKYDSLRINGGGLGGRAGKNVVLDQISSQVAVSAQVKRATLSLGGLFGFSSASVDSWSEASYTGLYGNISGITSGIMADVYVGGLTGLLQNAYVNRFEVSAQSTFLIANSIGENSGLAAVGGLAGVVYIAEGKSEGTFRSEIDCFTEYKSRCPRFLFAFLRR